MPIGLSNWASQTEISVPSGAGPPLIVTAPTNTWGSSLLSRSGRGSGTGSVVGVGIGVGVCARGVAVGIGVAVGAGVGVDVDVGFGVAVVVGGTGVGGVVVRLTPVAHPASTKTKPTMIIASFNGLID